MRIFDETTKELITNPDDKLGQVVRTIKNEITWIWQETKAPFLPYKEITYEKTGGTELVPDDENYQPAEGNWGYNSEQYPDGEGATPPPYTPEVDGEVFEDIENVGEFHFYTPEELEQREREEAKRKEQAKANAEQNAAINDMLNNDAPESVVQGDEANCILYESVPELTAKNKSDIARVEVFCQAYGRRIDRGEIAIADCPPELQERIQEIEDSKNMCHYVGDVENGLVNGVQGIDRNFNCETTLNLVIEANAGYRVPTNDELARKAKFSAQDKNAGVIANYFEEHCNYYTNGSNSATLSIFLTENVGTILSSLACLKA